MPSDALLSFLQKHQLKGKWRVIMSVVLGLLLIFHVFVLVAPFICEAWGSVIPADDDYIKHLHYVSESLLLVTSTLVIILLLTYAQARFVTYFEPFEQTRQKVYENVKKEIMEWLAGGESPVTDENVRLDHDPAVSSRLMHLKVNGNVKRIMDQSGLPQEAQGDIQKYCEAVHFELTNYPAELLYGVHFEFPSTEVNRQLSERAKEILAIETQYPALVPDKSVPKKPGWIFLCIRVELSGDFEKDLPNIATHARHFVELVGHMYDLLYCKRMVDNYLSILSEEKM